MFELTTPVAFIIFNRPDTTKEVFEKIREAKPKKLYLISDAPREGREDDVEKVNETRGYVESHIDWDCELHKNYAESNMGCKNRVYTGIPDTAKETLMKHPEIRNLFIPISDYPKANKMLRERTGYIYSAYESALELRR
jgi:hypothetical protein